MGFLLVKKVKRILFVLILVSVVCFGTQALYGTRGAVGDEVDILRQIRMIQRGGVRGSNDSVLDKADAMETFLRLKELYEQRLAAENAGAKDPEKCESYKEVIDSVKISLKQVARKISLRDAVLRASIGEAAWKDLQTLTTGKEWWLTVGGYVAAIKGAEVFGKRLDNVLNESLGEPLSRFCLAGTKGIGRWIRYCMDSIVGVKGDPFDCQEVEFWQSNLNKTLLGLERWAKNSGMLGQRDKVIRSWMDGDEEDEETVDQSWKWQRDLYERRLRSVANCIRSRLRYHIQKGDLEVVEYASQIRDWILGYLENVLLKTKSHKDLGSSSNRVALSNLIEELTNAFVSLLNHLDPGRSKNPFNAFARRSFNPPPRGNNWRMHEDDMMGDNF